MTPLNKKMRGEDIILEELKEGFINRFYLVRDFPDTTPEQM